MKVKMFRSSKWILTLGVGLLKNPKKLGEGFKGQTLFKSNELCFNEKVSKIYII
jgi:hypothetical protein